MKLFISLILFSTLIIGCNNQHENLPLTSFVPNGKGIVRFHFVNVKDTGSYWLVYNSHLPANQYTGSFLVMSDTVINYEVNATFPTTVFFVNNYNHNVGGYFMVLPNDTLQLRIDDTLVSFSGKTEEICEYLIKEKVNIYNNFPEKDETPESYNDRIDSVSSATLNKFNEYCNKNKLPEWFIEYEKNDIIASCEYLKQLQFEQRFWKYNQIVENKYQRDIKLVEKKLNINWLTDNTINYLDIIHPDKYDTLKTPQRFNVDLYFEYVQDNINKVNGKLSDQVMSYFVSSKLSSFIDVVLREKNLKFNEKTEMIESVFKSFLPLIKDTVCINFINECKNLKYKEFQHPVKLEQGQDAPFFNAMRGEKATIFYLEDVGGKKVNLSQYKGKLICLNFWGTNCSPCIRSIPEKNEMVRKYTKNNFVLINIVLDKNFRRWREIINEKEFKGVHLKCPGNWDKILAEKYKIGPIPHYTLIDKNGTIILNNVPRDSLSFYVKENL